MAPGSILPSAAHPVLGWLEPRDEPRPLAKLGERLGRSKAILTHWRTTTQRQLHKTGWLADLPAERGAKSAEENATAEY